MLSHSIEHGVLVITLHTDPGIGQRAALSQEITDRVHAYSPLPVVIVLDMPEVGALPSAPPSGRSACAITSVS